MEDQKQAFSHVEQLNRVDTSAEPDVNIKKVENLLIAHDHLFSEGRPKWEVVKENKKAMAVILILLIVISVPSAGLVIDRIGRRFTMWIGLTILIIAGAVQLAAQSWRTFCIVKVLYGLAGGFTQVSSITFVSEIAPPTTGITLAAFITFYSNEKYSSPDDNLGYRIPEIVVLVLPVLILILQAFFLVETPYFLLLSGKSEQAERNMRKLYPGQTEEQYAIQFAEYEYILLNESKKKELEAGSTFWDCLK
ncbi:MFS general substrate transporter [Penicillium malachiteum]|nr:MFS general substrate transporter [Penicillium malachiteum]